MILWVDDLRPSFPLAQAILPQTVTTTKIRSKTPHLLPFRRVEKEVRLTLPPHRRLRLQELLLLFLLVLLVLPVVKLVLVLLQVQRQLCHCLRPTRRVWYGPHGTYGPLSSRATMTSDKR